MKLLLGWFLKGFAMGAANVIPGVSGGTIAFITGIYERLIIALRNIDWQAIRFFFSFDFNAFSAKIDLRFLVTLFLGVAFSILSLARVLEWAFTEYERLTLAFFFGLILASIVGIGRQMDLRSWSVWMAFFVGIASSVMVAFLPPSSENSGYLYIILCGIVAVCSMILPGISGSYILLLMGNYVLVLRAISSLDFNILLPLLLGCIIGLAAFSRLLTYLFKHYRNLTVGVLSGFVTGSLLIIWPWKTTEYQMVTEGKEKAVGYQWNLPDINVEFMVALLLMGAGFLLVYWIEKVGATETDQ
jgi:putative membrane protein